MKTSQISGQLLIVIYILIFIAIYYFLILLPQRRRAQEKQKLLSSLKVNDKVLTIGGIIGTVKSINDDTVKLQIDKDVTLKVVKGAIDSIMNE
ncbi:MAG: preprotein translocase subunit YajC [Actinomycetota bacterium]|nr:preprotein translocase subunit YajC [Actinomycetota bacterium]